MHKTDWRKMLTIKIVVNDYVDCDNDNVDRDNDDVGCDNARGGRGCPWDKRIWLVVKMEE